MDVHQRAVVNRLKTARGHVNGIITIVEDDAYCPDVMKQLAAVQGLLEGASRLMLRRHLETCVAKAMQEGRTAEIVDELMETLKFDKHVFRTPQDPEHQGPEHGGPEHGGPEHGGPEHGGPEHGGPEHGGPEHGGPEHGGPEHGGPEHGGAGSEPEGAAHV